MKVALCFIISYDNQLNKEKIWRDWIQPNKDIINVYFHYKKNVPIKSEWIKKHALPANFLVETDYLHIAPAYITLMMHALKHDTKNQWFSFLTESCVPIISPLRFRELFFESYQYSFMAWKNAWWNTNLVKRANLRYLEPKYHLANTPWFILNRDDALRCIKYVKKNRDIYNLICIGDVANESLFSIMLEAQNSLKFVKNEDIMATDWNRMVSSTSPYLFKDGGYKDKKFIEAYLTDHKYTMFLRKVDKTFPDKELTYFIGRDNDNIEQLIKRKHRVFWLEKKWQILKYYYYFYYFIRRGGVLGVIAVFMLGFVIWQNNLTFPSITTINACNERGHWFIC